MTIELRKREMIDSLPLYYSESPEVDAIMHGNATEIERMHAQAADLLAQLYVSTATWGLAYWERVLAMEPAPRMSAQNRRNRILARLNGTAPATVAYLTDVVNSYVSDKSARITEINTEYRFLVDLKTNVETDVWAIGAGLNELKPAHIDYAYRQTTKSAIYYATSLSTGEEVSVYPWSPTSIELHGRANLGSYSYDYDTTSVYPKGEL